MACITFEATRTNLDNVLDFVNTKLANFDCDEELKTKINIAVEEIFVNISSYAYDSTGTVDVSCNVDESTFLFEIEFKDSGKPYNPLEREDPNVSASIDERGIGGLGIFMTKRLMDDIKYAYKDGKNILTIRKKIKEEELK